MAQPTALFSKGQFVKYVGDNGTVYKVRIDVMNHKSLGNMWIYSGEGQPMVVKNDVLTPFGKTRIMLNMREKELTAWTD